MYEAKCLVAGRNVVDDDAKAIHIHNVRKDTLFLGHLLVNAVEVLFAADDFAGDTVFLHRFFELFGNAFYDLALTALAFL